MMESVPPREEPIEQLRNVERERETELNRHVRYKHKYSSIHIQKYSCLK